MFFCESFEHLPASDRKAALSLFAERKSPWSAHAYAVVWKGGVAQLWVWPLELEGAGGGIAFPEALIFPKAERPGVRLVQCSNGFLLQHWAQNTLLAETWFPGQPGDQDIAWFCRARSLPVLRAGSLETVSEAQASPWRDFRKPLPRWVRDRRGGAVWLASTCVLLLLAIPVSSGLKARYQADLYSEELEQARAAASELLAVRGKARRDAFRRLVRLGFEIPMR